MSPAARARHTKSTASRAYLAGSTMTLLYVASASATSVDLLSITHRPVTGGMSTTDYRRKGMNSHDNSTEHAALAPPGAPIPRAARPRRRSRRRAGPFAGAGQRARPDGGHGRDAYLTTPDADGGRKKLRQFHHAERERAGAGRRG